MGYYEDLARDFQDKSMRTRIEDIEEMGKRISNSRVAICKKGAHFSMHSDQGTYFRELIRFIKNVEAERFKLIHS